MLVEKMPKILKCLSGTVAGFACLLLVACDSKDEGAAAPDAAPETPEVTAESPQETDTKPLDVPEVPAEPTLVLAELGFSDLPGWSDDQLGQILPAIQRSCQRFLALPAGRDVGTGAIVMKAGDWHGVCGVLDASGYKARDPEIRTLFETELVPFQASDRGETKGLFTGYFEADLSASGIPDEDYRYPIYRRPDDHVIADLGVFNPDLKGKTVIGRVEDGRFIPYPERSTLETGHLDGKGLELFWARDPIDVFLLQVQGSGRVTLPDGRVVRIGFDGHNGQPYRSIGRALIDRGELELHQASWDGIRGWMQENPDQASSLLYENPRYVFFRILKGDGPIGAEGVALTPGRSIAVDRKFIPMGVPVWLDTVWPRDPEKPLQRLLMAQDTGGAIKGPVRGDFFWGFGAEALKYAGSMKSRGDYYLLLPKAAAERVNRDF